MGIADMEMEVGEPLSDMDDDNIGNEKEQEPAKKDADAMEMWTPSFQFMKSVAKSNSKFNDSEEAIFGGWMYKFARDWREGCKYDCCT